MTTHSAQEAAILEDLEANRRRHAIHQKNLHQLKERAARYGLGVGVDLKNEIEHEESEVRKLDREHAELLSRRGVLVPQVLQPLPTALGKYDAFVRKLTAELDELNHGNQLRHGRLETLAIAAVYATGIAEHAFVARHANGKWSVQAEDRGATAELGVLVERSPALRDLLTRSAQLEHATTVAFGEEDRRCVFVPFIGNKQQVLVLYGLSREFEPDNALDIILSTLLVATRGLTQQHPSAYIEAAIYNALRKQLGFVSLPMYERQFELFKQRLVLMTVFFEPIISLSPDTPRIWAWKALARDADTEVAPADLFQTADLWGTRFKLELDMYFLRKATEVYVQKVIEAYPRDPQQEQARTHEMLPLSVNVNPESLIRTRYYETVNQIRAAKRMPLDMLFLEISEKSSLPELEKIQPGQHPVEAFREQLFPFMDFGIRFSIDDFGVGFASSSRLSRLGPDCVKIDRDALSDTFGHYTLSYVLGLTRRMHGHIDVIVEGFDSESVYSLRRLYELGVRYVQGHTYGRARPEIDNRLPKATVQHIRTLLHGL